MIGLSATHLGKNVIAVSPGICVDDSGEELLMHSRRKLVMVPKEGNKTFKIYLLSGGQLIAQEKTFVHKLYRSAQVGEFKTNEKGEV
jgi:hypothetical protein